jgi:hypothetical protein
LISAGVTSWTGRTGPGERQEEDAARFAERDEALRVDAREDALHRGLVRPLPLHDREKGVVEREEPLGEGGGRGRPEDARGGEARRALEGDDRPAGGAAPRVDAEDPHRRAGLRVLEVLVVDVAARPDLLDVVVVLEHVEELQERGRLVADGDHRRGIIWSSAVCRTNFFASSCAFTVSNDARSV